MGMCPDGNCPECQAARRARANDPEWLALAAYVRGEGKTLAQTNTELINAVVDRVDEERKYGK